MPYVRPTSLRKALVRADLTDRHIISPRATAPFREVVQGWSLAVDRRVVSGCSAAVVTNDQLSAALALIDLDGLARRIVVTPPDLQPRYLAAVIGDAEVDTIISDLDPATFASLGKYRVVSCGTPTGAREPVDESILETEWVLLTSGTTGPPKMVVHSLEALTAAIGSSAEGRVVWATFYDIRRYGGLQILLRAVLGAHTLVLSAAGESIPDHLGRLATCGATHISGTPSHWRAVMMSGRAGAISPDYIRLSGEITDQPILNSLREAYPQAKIGHAYASTEAGVGFVVDDCLEGFPSTLIDSGGSGAAMKVEDGSLRIRSRGAASRYLGRSGDILADEDGYIDTGDLVELRNGRYYFVGRRGGIINVGGLKVNPEEVEAVINRHRCVRMSLVKARRSPIIGAVVVADVVLNGQTPMSATGPESDALRDEIIQLCRRVLSQHKVPAAIRFVRSLSLTPAGKLARV
jgi:acyl-coenzyme A synthetase/AMP-(fatty) acid ligase